jgi:uncharacterized protein YjbI with pentapeptide repeats
MAESAPLKDYRNRSFKGQDLSGQDFSGRDLRGCDFRDAKLRGVDFSGSTFGQTAQQRINSIAAVAAASTFVYVSFSAAYAGSGRIDTVLFSTLASVAIAAIAAAAGFYVASFVTFFLIIVLCVTGVFSIVFQAFSAFNRGAFLEGVFWAVVAVFSNVSVFMLFKPSIAQIGNAPGTRFGGADLTGAIFVKAKLDNCDFDHAVLLQVNWTGAIIKRSRITLDSTMELLLHRKGNGGSYDGKNFNDQHMAGIDLSKAVLNNSNLSRANLQHADLQNASLVNVQANGTDFRHARLSGACIQKWSINADTRFDEVICDHIFLTPDRDPQSRRPLSGSFEKGDFELLLDKFAKTLDFILRRGTDPIAFKQALAQFKRDNPEAQIKAMLELDVDRVLVQATVPEGSDTVKIHADFHKTLQLKEQEILRLTGTIVDLQTISQLNEQEIRHLTGTIADRDQTISMMERLFNASQRSIQVLQANHPTGDLMPNNSTNPQIQAGGDAFYVGGDNSGVVGKDQTGVAGGDISGTLTLDQLKQSPDPKAQTLGDHLKTLKTAIEAKDAGLSDDRKTKALNLITQLTNLATTQDKSAPNFLEQASDTIEDLDNIVKKGSGLAEFAEKNLPTIMAGIRFCMGLAGMG